MVRLTAVNPGLLCDVITQRAAKVNVFTTFVRQRYRLYIMLLHQAFFGLFSINGPSTSTT